MCINSLEFFNPFNLKKPEAQKEYEIFQFLQD